MHKGRGVDRCWDGAVTVRVEGLTHQARLRLDHSQDEFHGQMPVGRAHGEGRAEQGHGEGRASKQRCPILMIGKYRVSSSSASALAISIIGASTCGVRVSEEHGEGWEMRCMPRGDARQLSPREDATGCPYGALT